MFGLAPLLIRRLGLLCLMLLTIAAVLPASEALACAPTSPPDAAASTALQTAPATEDGCGDCALSCAHGCCHAPHVGILGGATAPVPVADTPMLQAWTHDTGQRPAAVGGPDRPPQA